MSMLTDVLTPPAALVAVMATRARPSLTELKFNVLVQAPLTHGAVPCAVANTRLMATLSPAHVPVNVIAADCAALNTAFSTGLATVMLGGTITGVVLVPVFVLVVVWIGWAGMTAPLLQEDSAKRPLPLVHSYFAK